jgi:hypothetical protein
MKTYEEVKVEIHELLTSILDASGWSSERPDRFIPNVRTPGTLWIGGWMDLSAGKGAVEKRVSCLYRKRKSNFLAA